ncbi:hypothetical protein LY10_02688 [Planktotalea frisia]|jgi:uncharacterized protein HemY|uniref:Apolipoprotein acyltransferase n=1 Tax=Planktotalea frisia TaxID=696762 RepID=A0A1L9NUV4_9RHOB|nr:hypothetical protein [Planktotalea frisia]OJI93080.1 hypothetical protein PFRI_27280 [Planktotalea frisia]PZX25894.1 hypothetical protein LY10_02688 [Planktotalea frisia]
MIYTIAGLLGIALGAWRAKKAGGNWADMAQYAAGFGIAFLLIGFIITLIVHRMAV